MAEKFWTDDKPQLSDLVWFCWHTGCRLSEPLSIEWENIRFDTATSTAPTQNSLLLFRDIGLGPYIKSSRRHHIQHSQYTICRSERDSHDFYASHEVAFQSEETLRKYTIPVSERVTALKWLDKMNINAFTLYDDQNALMEMLSNREFLFR